MELALYGGAFNPPHNAHKKIIEYCYNRFDLVIVMPNGKSVNKKIDISKHHRLKMLEMVTKDYNERVVIDSYEIDSTTKNYSIDTIKYLEEKYSTYKISMIIGSDQLLDFDSWKENRKILDKVDIICINRFNNKVIKMINKVEYVNDINIDISSSHIKLQLQNKLPINKSLIDPKVIHYIEQNKLYAS